jgi:AcrR family transcriptional regulator
LTALFFQAYNGSVTATLPPKPRRSQAERTAETRARLLEAAIESVSALGYHATTTSEIARRAGLSRGAQLNHFPTKGELMLAALEHLYARRDADFRTAVAELPEGGDRLNRAIDTLWSFADEPTFLTWLELEMAARTDPDLRARVLEHDRKFRDMTERTWREMFPGDEDNPIYRMAPAFTWALLDGLGLQKTTGYVSPAEAAEVLDLFKMLARFLLGGGGGTETS